MAEATPPTPPPTVAPVAAVVPAAATVLSLRDEKGRLTRTGMEAAIRSGGSVIHNGVVHSSIDTLPSPAELAKGDKAAEQVVAADLQRQLDQINAQLGELKTVKAATANEAAAKAMAAKDAEIAKLKAELDAANKTGK